MGIAAGAAATGHAATGGTDRVQAGAQRAVTEHLLALAGRAGGAAALIDGAAARAGAQAEPHGQPRRPSSPGRSSRA
jgi:hypothetical protein